MSWFARMVMVFALVLFVGPVACDNGKTDDTDSQETDVEETDVEETDVAPTCDNTSDECLSEDGTSGCMICAQAEDCAPEVEACAESADCASFQACAHACGPGNPTCTNGCVQANPTGYSLFAAVLACAVCDTCPTVCAAEAQQIGCP